MPPLHQTAGVEELFADVDGARVRYLRSGSGPPLILLHGLLGYSFSWRFTLPALSEVATCYAVDLPGTGYSDDPSDLDRTLRATAERVLKFIDALGLKSYDLLGTSHGGAVAQFVAAISAKRDDPRLQRLILVAPVNPFSRHGRFLAPALGSHLGSFVFRRTILRWRMLDSVWLSRMFGDARRIPPDALAGYRAPILARNGFEHGLRIVRSWTRDLRELEGSLPTIAHYPALLMWGTKDPAVPIYSAERLRANFRDCRLVMFPGAGHLPYEEFPDDFNHALIAFLIDRERSAGAD
jgi:pimeloyl-ACP methyl ester carboxylesterase